VNNYPEGIQNIKIKKSELDADSVFGFFNQLTAIYKQGLDAANRERDMYREKASAVQTAESRIADDPLAEAAPAPASTAAPVPEPVRQPEACLQLIAKVDALQRENALLREMIEDAIKQITAKAESVCAAARAAAAAPNVPIVSDVAICPEHPFQVFDQKKREAEEREAARKSFLSMFQKTRRDMDELYGSMLAFKS